MKKKLGKISIKKIKKVRGGPGWKHTIHGTDGCISETIPATYNTGCQTMVGCWTTLTMATCNEYCQS
jgi:hypothetical protein